MSKSQLLFVYNADSGLFNTLGDIGHKIFSPGTYNCQLCTLSHGYFSERKEWTAFIDSLPVSPVFLHRDEFQEQYPDVKTAYPAVFILLDNMVTRCLGNEDISDCKDIKSLQEAIIASCIENS